MPGRRIGREIEVREEQMLVEISRHKLLARRTAIEEGLPVADLGLQFGRHRAPACQARVSRSASANRARGF